MKRLLVLFVALTFLFCGSVFAAEAAKAKPAVPAAKAEPDAMPAKAMEKETKMSATGKVTEISDTMLKIERTVKGKAETMEFTLEKASPEIAAGDKVKVSYVTKDDKNITVKVTKITKKVTKKHAKKKVAVKEVKPAEEKAAPVEAAPPAKK